MSIIILMKELRTVLEKIFFGRMERRKTTILMAKKILICLVLLQCCIAAVSAIPINFGETVTGTITTLGQTDSYSFTATAGDTIYSRMISNWSAGPQIRLNAPNGTQISVATLTLSNYATDITQILPSTGIYTMLVGDNFGDSTGTYGLFLQRTNNSGNAEPIAFGETKTGSITKLAEMKNFTFNATLGDTIYSRMETSWSGGPEIRVFAPNGTQIAITYDGSSPSAEMTQVLPLNGTYTLLAGDRFGDETGTYGLFLQRTNNAGNAEPIAFGETKTGSITKLAEMKNYTFTASYGDTIYSRMNANWSAGPQIRLYAPNGTQISVATLTLSNYATDLTQILPSTGIYAMLVGDNFGDSTGTYDLYLQLVGTNAVTADFSANTTSGVAPLAVQFTDSSTNSPNAWSWDFGDGNTSTLQNASNIYGSPNQYTVTLTATNSYGSNTTTKTKYIEVTKVRKSMIAIFRAATGYWYFDYNLDGIVNNSFRYGGAGDQIIRGDWQGTGRDGIAIFRNSTGYWYFDYNLDGIVDKSFRYGGSTDRIIVGKWQGIQDGIAIFRPASGYWYFDYNLDGIVDKSFRYGGSTDQIIKGDWDGDGKDGIAIFRPSTGYWYFDYNLDGIIDKSFRYGGVGDLIIQGNWNGTLQDGIAIFRPAAGYWYFDYNLDGIVDNSFRYGGVGDKIAKGDWNGDGSDGIAIFRPSSGYWYFDYNLDGIVDKAFRYGGNTDQIIAGKWA